MSGRSGSLPPFAARRRGWRRGTTMAQHSPQRRVPPTRFGLGLLPRPGYFLSRGLGGRPARPAVAALRRRPRECGPARRRGRAPARQARGPLRGGPLARRRRGCLRLAGPSRNGGQRAPSRWGRSSGGGGPASRSRPLAARFGLPPPPPALPPKSAASPPDPTTAPFQQHEQRDAIAARALRRPGRRSRCKTRGQNPTTPRPNTLAPSPIRTAAQTTRSARPPTWSQRPPIKTTPRPERTSHRPISTTQQPILSPSGDHPGPGIPTGGAAWHDRPGPSSSQPPPRPAAHKRPTQSAGSNRTSSDPAQISRCPRSGRSRRPTRER